VVSYLRFAAGICVLSIGLLLGASGGAIAVADTDSSGSTSAGDDDATASSEGSGTASSPVGSTSDPPRKTLQGLTSAFGSGRTAGQQPSTSAESPTSEPVGADTTIDNEDSDIAAEVSTPVAPVPTAVDPVTNVVEPDPNAVEPVANVVEPDPGVVEPVANVVEPVANVVEPDPGVVEPVANVVEPVPTVDASAPSVVAPVPNVVAPVSTVVAGLVGTTADVITAVQDLFTSAAGAVLAFTSLPPDLSALLGVPAVSPVREGSSAAAGPWVLAPPMALQSPVVPPQTGIPGVTWADNATGVAPLGGIATTLLGQESPLPEAGLAPDGIVPTGVREFFQKAFDELRRSPALAALVWAALPGVGGLLIVTAAGVRLGYRQAKAGLALRTAGIARFARYGPIGVVRSGSLVFVRPRAAHVVRRGTLGARCVLDEAA
jgi:hypothetical protein